MTKLKDKVAVITGATSGMALATAKLFVEEGHTSSSLAVERSSWTTQ